MPFSLLKKLFASSPKGPDFDQIIWGTDAGKFKALIERTQQHTATGGKVLVLAWFAKTEQELHFLLTSMNIRFATSLSDAAGHNVVVELADRYLSQLPHTTGFVPMAQIWLAEHYPLHASEVALFEKLASEAPNTKPIIFTSMDEQLFTAFGGARIKDMMESLGMKKDEPMQHNMIKQSVINAQKKVAEQVVSEQKAHSGEAWFTANYRTPL